MASPIADMVERMLAANEPAVAIVSAVRALEGVTLVTRYVTATSRVTSREQARVRQLNWRKRKKEQGLAKEVQANDGTDRNASVTRDSVTATLSDCDLLSSSLLSGEPLKSSKKEKKESSGIRARGTRLASGTPLSEEHRAVAIENGCPAGRVDAVWMEFVDYWSDIPGQRGCKVSWTGTWRNRVKSIFGAGFRNGSNNGKPPSRIIQAADDLCRKAAEFDGPSGQNIELRDPASAAVVRLLPHR